ncbi:ribonuclease E inhibitor RraB [Tundrisphaera lichenicola]|uniref:ribonuclease E inhibitor RraB n=1 Tax=Tundrisphaera lichenicola TaxID=2029860 RepID=UPI003EBD0A2E
MDEDFPSDADGDALRRVVALGNDLSRAMEIDYFIVVPNREVGEVFAALAERAGFRVELEQDEEASNADVGDEASHWTCYCSKTMLATYLGVTEAQIELDKLSRPLGGFIDGWGTSGNQGDT